MTRRPGTTRRALLLTVVFSLVSTVVLAPPAAAILGGELDNGRHPYVVHLVNYQTTRDGLTGAVVGHFKGFCSGFAVSPTLVVTAGHCVTAEQPGDSFPPGGDGFVEHRQIDGVGIFTPDDPAANPLYEARLGFDAFGEAIPHPFFVSEFYDHDFPVHLYDVGVVVLRPEAPLALDRYAQLPEAHAAEALHTPPGCAQTENARCPLPWLLAAGYGTHDDPSGYEPTPPRHLASIRYEGIEPLFEQRYFSFRGGIEGHESVAAGSPCLGDSGGPLLLDGTDTAVGLTSTGPNPTCDFTGLGQRIDLPDIQDWIRSHM